MKVCKKCKNEYKDDYKFCNKCGEPYDETVKRAKVPTSSEDIVKTICSIFLYLIGVLFVIAGVSSMRNDIANILVVGLGVSLFPVIYQFIENKTSIEKKYIKIAKIAIPILFLICISVAFPTTDEQQSVNNNDTNSNIGEVEKVENKNDGDTQPKVNENINDNSATEETNTNNYMDAMRKCAVMEGADIYTTGIGKKSDNVFNDGRETCEQWYQQWGENQFIKAVTEDWNNRQNELVDGKPLSHYLEILGW